jgi:hypothetical protein
MVRALLVAVIAAATISATPRRDAPAVVAHEWGTFTTIADQQGRPMEWLPLGGPQDLPCFVDYFRTRQVKVFPGQEPPLSYEQSRSALRGTVRMETPVIYFYADEPASLDVEVQFPRGLMTEWYPKAVVQQPDVYASLLRDGGYSTISWRGVQVRPGNDPAYPQESQRSHYYAARDTDATPIRVGGQDEKFLFYRGVAGFDVPLRAVAMADGRVRVTGTAETGEAIPAAIYFEHRRGRIGYTVARDITADTILERPALTASFASLAGELEAMLVKTGLFAREAKAMVETWRDSWFEEGARIFYLVPERAVNRILPLRIAPSPTSVARAFVGRMEVVTPATIDAVLDALAGEDEDALAPYARFLEPIAKHLDTRLTPELRARTATELEAHYKALMKHTSSTASACQ